MSKSRDAHDDLIYTWYDLESDRLYLKRNGIREEAPPITRDYIRDLNDRINALRSRCDDAILSNGRWMKRYAKLMRKNAETQQQLNDAMESMGRVEDRCAKLRELVRDMLPFAEVGIDDACVARRCCLFEQCEDTTVAKCTIEQHMLDRMRELGIEVSE